MDNPAIIPDESITTPSGSTGSVRPGDEDPLTIPSDQPDKTITIDLINDKYKDAPESIQIGVLTVTYSDNVGTFSIFIQPEGSTGFVPLDLNEDGIPDVC